MKSNLFKYIFIVFVIIIMVFAIYKIRTDEEQKSQMQQNQQVDNEANKIREINLAIAEYDTMNPIISKNKNVQDIQKLIYEPLINLTSDYKIEPCLAKECEKQTETTYIIKLREGVTWSDGTPFTAEDVRFTIDRLKDTDSIYSSNVQAVVQVDAVDSSVVKITLGEEVPFFEYNLNFPIVQSANYSNESIPGGTGKYVIVDNNDQNIILQKNEKWWGSKDTNLSLEKITVNKYASLGELYNSFKIGNVDVISTDNTNLQQYIGKIGYNEKQMQGREHTFLILNTQNNYLQSQKVRKAISYSIDKDNIVSSVYGNNCYTSSFPLEFGSWVYQNQNSSAGYNPEQGKQELTDDGWTLRNNRWQKTASTQQQTNQQQTNQQQANQQQQETQETTARARVRRSTRRTTTSTSSKLELNLLVKQSDSSKVAVAENIKSQLENIGIGINIVQASDATYTENLNNKRYDIALCTINSSPNPSLELFFGENNFANYNNDEVNELMKEVKNTHDEQVIKNDFQKLSEIYKNDVPYISLYTSKHTVVYSVSLLGEFAPNWFSSFYGIQTWGK